jgi:hypothetical protein
MGALPPPSTTFHHQFYNITREAFVGASELKAGDQLQQSAGSPAVVESVRLYHAKIFTYDLAISGLHTYYVLAGETPVLVHNAPANCKLSNTIGKFADQRFGRILANWFPGSHIESQFRIWTPYGWREADYAVRDGGGWKLFEVKANKSRYTKTQRKKDTWIENNLGWKTTVVRMSQPCPVGC